MRTWCCRIGLFLSLVTALFISGGAFGVYAQSKPALEYRIKAAFIYKIIKFVEWPGSRFGSSQAPFFVCVLGEDPFGESLEKIFEGKVAHGRALSVKRSEELSDLEDCHIIFISGSEAKNLEKILKAIQSNSVLTIGDTENFSLSGGMIGFQKKGKKLQLEINLKTTQKAGLSISSKLLVLAKVIR